MDDGEVAERIERVLSLVAQIFCFFLYDECRFSVINLYVQKASNCQPFFFTFLVSTVLIHNKIMFKGQIRIIEHDFNFQVIVQELEQSF